MKFFLRLCAVLAVHFAVCHAQDVEIDSSPVLGGCVGDTATSTYPVGCLHGLTVRFKLSTGTWPSIPTFVFEDNDNATSTLRVAPVCTHGLANNEYAWCTLKVTDTGPYQLTITAGSTSVSLPMNVTAPYLEAATSATNCDGGVPGTFVFGCAMGSEITWSASGFDAFVGTYDQADTSKVEAILEYKSDTYKTQAFRQPDVFPSGSNRAQCVRLTITSSTVSCLLYAQVSAVYGFGVKLTPTDAVFNVLTAVVGESVTPGIDPQGRGIGGAHPYYPFKMETSIETSGATITSITSPGCMTTSNGVNSSICDHAAVLTIAGRFITQPFDSLASAEILFMAADSEAAGYTAPTCNVMSWTGYAIVCQLSYSHYQQIGNYTVLVNQTIGCVSGACFLTADSDDDVTGTADISTGVYIPNAASVGIIARPPLFTGVTTGCPTLDGTKATACYGGKTIAIAGRGWSPVAVSDNSLAFGAAATAPSCNPLTVTTDELTCLLYVPAGQPGTSYYITVTSIGLAIPTSVELLDPVTSIANSQYPSRVNGASVLTVSSSLSQKLLELGGDTSTSVTSYDVESNTWATEAYSLPAVRCGLTAAAVAPLNSNSPSVIYALGGSGQTTGPDCLEGRPGTTAVYKQSDAFSSSAFTKVADLPVVTSSRVVNGTTFVTSQSYSHLRFGLRVKNNLRLTALEVRSATSGDSNVQVHIKLDSPSGSDNSAEYMKVHDSTVYFPGGSAVIPIAFPASIQKMYRDGLRSGKYTLYISSSVSLETEAGPSTSTTVYKSNADIDIYGAESASTQFGTVSATAFFSGSIHYEVDNDVCVAPSDDSDTTLSGSSINSATASRNVDVILPLTSDDLSGGNYHVEILAGFSSMNTDNSGAAASVLVSLNCPGGVLTQVASVTVTSASSGYYLISETADTTSVSSPTRNRPQGFVSGSINTFVNTCSGTPGQWTVQFQPSFGTNGAAASLVVDVVELRICKGNAGLVGHASTGIGPNVYTAGGLIAGLSGFGTSTGGSAPETTAYLEGHTSLNSFSVYIADSVSQTAPVLTVPPKASYGMVGQWLADGTSFDTSGYGHDATLVGAPMLATTCSGDATYGYRSLGLTGGQHVSIPMYNKPHVESRMAWVRFSATPTIDAPILAYTSSTGEYYSVFKVQPDGLLSFTEKATGSATTVLTPNNVAGYKDVRDGQWWHVAMTKDAAGMVSIYIDGYRVTSLTGFGATEYPINLLSDLTVGYEAQTWSGGSTKYLAGFIQDVRHYDRVLTATELRSIAVDGCGGQKLTPSGTYSSGIYTGTVSTTDLSFGSGQVLIAGLATGGSSNIESLFMVDGVRTRAAGGANSLAEATNTFSHMRSLQVPRYGHKLLPVGDYLYAIGGYRYFMDTAYPVTEVEVCDPSHAIPVWMVAGNMPAGRFDFAASVDGGNIWVTGGVDATGTVVGSTIVLDTTTGTWTSMTTAPTASSTYNLVTPRRGAQAGVTMGKFVFTGGDDSTGTPVPTSEVIDVMGGSECWKRMDGVQALGWPALSGDPANVWSLGTKTDEMACAQHCKSIDRCAAYIFVKSAMSCYARTKFGIFQNEYHADTISAYRGCQGTPSVIQATAFQGTAETQTAFLEFTAQPGSLTIYGFTFNMLVGDEQTVTISYQTSNTALTSGTAVLPFANTLTTAGTLKPGTPGRAYLALATPLTLTRSTAGSIYQFGFEFQMISLAFTTPDPVPNLDSIITIGASYSSGVAGRPDIAIHYDYFTHVTNDQCFTEAINASAIAPSNGIALSMNAGGAIYTEGLKVFFRWMSISLTGRQGFVHKARQGAFVRSEGGYAVSLINGQFGIQTVTGWVMLTSWTASANTWYNTLITFQPDSGTWTFRINNVEYSVVANIMKEIGIHDIYIGSEGGINPITGEVAHVAFDCTSVQYDGNNVYPQHTVDGIKANLDPRITMPFRSDVQELGGNIYYTNSVYDGLYDNTITGTQTLALNDTSVSLANMCMGVINGANVTSMTVAAAPSGLSVILPPQNSATYTLTECTEGMSTMTVTYTTEVSSTFPIRFKVNGLNYPTILPGTPNTIPTSYYSQSLALYTRGGSNTIEILNDNVDGSWVNITVVSIEVSGSKRLNLDLPSNFSYDVRYQVAMDVGLVRSATDLSVFEGILSAAPTAGEWWFLISGDTRSGTCDGKMCAACDACQFLKLDGVDQIFQCQVQTSQGLIKFTRRNVPLDPTIVCP